MLRPRVPGFGYALCGLALHLTACAGSSASSRKAASPDAVPLASAAVEAETEAAAAPPSDTAPPRPVSESEPQPSPARMAAGMPGGDAAPAAPSAPGVTTAPTREMLDIEGHVTLRVAKTIEAVRALHALATRVGGVVTAEQLQTATRNASAELTLRVASGKAEGLLEQLAELGSVLEQNINARDIGKEYFDANLRLSSLETTLQRYREVLSHADKVDEILRIEAELGRLREEIEQVKGNLRWLSDRAARATLHVSIREDAPEIASAPPPPVAKFFPSLRLPALADFGKSGDETYAGGGFGLRFSRGFSLDLDLLKRGGSSERGPDALVATLGGETYSDLLGGGRRRYLNPYLGWRAGYARFSGASQALLGATLGLELYQNRWFGLDLETRNYLTFGSERGASYALEPALSARIAF